MSQVPARTPQRRRLIPEVRLRPGIIEAEQPRIAVLSPGDVGIMTKTSRIKSSKRTRIINFNLQGGLDYGINPVGLQTIILDMVKLNCDIALFQETKLRDDFELEDLQLTSQHGLRQAVQRNFYQFSRPPCKQGQALRNGLLRGLPMEERSTVLHSLQHER